MGIRCYCPNGHRLNIKAFLAGRVGRCPHCETPFRIPLESDPAREQPGAHGGGSPQSMDAAAGAAETPAAETPAAETPGEQQQAAAQPAEQPWAPQPQTQFVGQQPVGGPSPVLPAQQVGPAPQAPMGQPVIPQAAPLDPISESPDSVWYVRPPTGGQFGPARGDIMRRWIDEGRVTPDSLVWREGWPDWRRAEGLFPGNGGPPQSPAWTRVRDGR